MWSDDHIFFQRFKRLYFCLSTVTNVISVNKSRIVDWAERSARVAKMGYILI